MISHFEAVLLAVDELCDRSFDNFKARLAVRALRDMGGPRFVSYGPKDKAAAFEAGFALFSLFAGSPAGVRRYLRKPAKYMLKDLRKIGYDAVPSVPPAAAANKEAAPAARLPYADN